MKRFILLILPVLTAGCGNQLSDPLPVINNPAATGGDEDAPAIPDFAFVDQDSQLVTNATFAGKAYIADFFFTSCPTICPKVKQQMMRIYDKYETEDLLSLLSYSIDVRRDTVGRLKWYADNLGVKNEKWHFVTGDQDAIYDLADDYISTVMVDSLAPGGFTHSGYLILVDPKRRIRSYCDGTDPKAVDGFMQDIERLLYELKQTK